MSSNIRVILPQHLRTLAQVGPGIDEVEVIVVNDGSSDNTPTEAADAGAIVINLPGGGGLGMLIAVGLAVFAWWFRRDL